MSLSAGYKNFGYNYITTYNSLGISDGEVSPREMSIVIGVAYKLTNKLSVGLNANYISSDLIYFLFLIDRVITILSFDCEQTILPASISSSENLAIVISPGPRLWSYVI